MGLTVTTVTDGCDQGFIRWNKTFAEFVSYYGFIPTACGPYRDQTKGKVERLISTRKMDRGKTP